ncbi:flavin reductase family protein [Sphingobium lactosutens]|uniref:Flavin reductase like domain-containing protein n=1 Tax=Sphingobium lactosutens DS20 TaxID=1331060 RepID=T0HFL8_9SPHN|nr:flavin reductase [Sphingobium lactosutens]EQB11797.1 hypothetical protein RLDS_21960 [Sphingobium lactosutens DS20]
MTTGEITDIATDLRWALRSQVRPVWVMSTHWDGQDYAMAATAVAEVSMNPPSMLFCINRANGMFRAMENNATFAMNMLAAEHEAVSRACGGEIKGPERFTIGNWVWDDDTGVPLLADSAASIIAIPTTFVDHGSHRIIVATVSSIVRGKARSALCFRDGAYLPILCDN